jgi:oxygen-dependent protoporphyrinogen oxidase
MPARRVAVVGAGLGGLAAAEAVRAHAERLGRPVRVEVWEAGASPGGQLRTTVEDGYVIEWAANAFRTGVGPTADLVARLGLEEERVEAERAANRRYVFHGGRLHLLPSDPVSLLTFEPMSKEGRLRILAEPFRAERVDHEETVFAYAARHIGPEAAEMLLGTMVRGVYGGDAHQLSVDAAFPVMREMERDHRSLVVAAIAGMRDRMRERKTTWSFRGGMAAIVDRLAEGLGDALRLNAPVAAVRPRPDGGVALEPGDGSVERYDDVVLALPPEAIGPLIRPLDEEAAEELEATPTAPIGAVALAFDQAAFETPPDGFGFLVAPSEGLQVLGVLIESNVFPGRAPEGKVLLRAIQGGTGNTPIDQRSDEDLIAAAVDLIDRAWGLADGPERSWLLRQERGIPQYVLGHGPRLDRIEARLRAHGRLHLAGNAYHGIAVGKLVDDAERVAAAIWGESEATAGASGEAEAIPTA